MANEKNGVKGNTDGLDNLIDMLKNETYFLRVGIIGSKAKTAHKDSNGKTNAEIGTFHEFGSKDGKHPPRRSFLADSLKFKLNLGGQDARELRMALFKNLLKKGAIQKFLAGLGAKCLEIINDGFETNGFGMWKSYSEAYFKARQRVAQGKAKQATAKVRRSAGYWLSHSMLNVTGQLKSSISFKVMKRK